MKDTKIEWCDSTWNPVTGCLHNCEYCYARKQANRFKGCEKDKKAKIITRLNEAGTGDVIELNAPLKKRQRNGKLVTAPYPFGFKPTLHRYRMNQPKKWKDPRTIFVGSMADLFGKWVPDEWIEEVFAACEKASQHRYLFLTKNPARYATLFLNKKLPLSENMYYGVSVTNMENVSEALNCLGELPGKVKTFLSVEPLLEDVSQCIEWSDLIYYKCVKWIIIGAETGNRKEKVTPQKGWIDKICEAADITHMAVFMKDSLIPIIGEENMRREFPWRNLTTN